MFTQWALRPIVIHDFRPAGDSISHFLTPLGTSEKRGGEYTWQILPLARFHKGATVAELLAAVEAMRALHAAHPSSFAYAQAGDRTDTAASKLATTKRSVLMRRMR